MAGRRHEELPGGGGAVGDGVGVGAGVAVGFAEGLGLAPGSGEAATGGIEGRGGFGRSLGISTVGSFPHVKPSPAIAHTISQRVGVIGRHDTTREALGRSTLTPALVLA
jgi:hypothetical protein